MQRGDVGELTAETIERLDDDDVEGAGFGVGENLLVSRPEGAAARERPILVRTNQCPALGIDQPATNLDLILDRGVALLVGAVASLDHGARHIGLHSGSRRSIGPRRSAMIV